jgi:hypothetical protein
MYQNLARVHVDDIANTPAEADAAWAAALAAHTQEQGKIAVRAAIKNAVGDTASLLGTTADAAQLTVAAILADIVAISTTTTFSAYKTAKMDLLAALAGNDHATGNPVDITVMAQTIIGQIQTGDVKLTAIVKGVPGVLDEVFTRATGVADILIAAATSTTTP